MGHFSQIKDGLLQFELAGYALQLKRNLLLDIYLIAMKILALPATFDIDF